MIDEIAMGPFGSNIKVDCFVPSGVPVLNGSNLIGFTLTEDAFSYVTPEKAASLKRAVASRGDIVITHRGTLGQIVYIPSDSKYEKYVISQSQFRVKCKESEMLPEFMVYFFHSRKGQHQLLSNSSQVGVPALARPSSTFQELEMPVPTIEEQRVIVNTLSALDDRIGTNTKINHHLEQMAQASFERLIIEEAADEPLGVLSDIAEINPLRTLRKGNEATYIEMANLPTRGSFPINWAMRPYAGGMRFKNGDTIMARITPCLENGKTAFINFLGKDEIAFGSTEYIVIAPKPGYCHEMFYFLARYSDFVSYAVKNMNGSSGRQRVSGESIGAYELNIPSEKAVEEFSEIAQPIMKTIARNALESRTLAALRDALLPRLMSGELSVADIAAK